MIPAANVLLTLSIVNGATNPKQVKKGGWGMLQAL